MFLLDLFFQKKCTHEKVTPDVDFAYCPDCGKLVHNEWYITRCSCCGVKTKAFVRHGHVEPQNTFCQNCGSQEYSVEKLKKISFIDINFAVLVRKEENTKKEFVSTCRCWQEKTISPQKLLTVHL